MTQRNSIALTVEQQIVAREDAMQLGSCVDSLTAEADRLERLGRRVTADRLRETADRMDAERIRILDAIEGRTPATQERQPDAVEAMLRIAFSLPTLLVRLVLGLLASDAAVAAVEPGTQVEPPVVATPIASPASADDVPTATLAPVPLLSYTPAPMPLLTYTPTARAKPARKPRTARPKAGKVKAMPAAGRSIADPLAAAMRRVARGEAVRAAARAEGVSESTLRGRLKREAGR